MGLHASRTSTDTHRAGGAGEYDLLDMVPQHLRDYVDLEAWGRAELSDNYVARDAPDGGVFVFGTR